MVNVAEEVKRPQRNLPIAILVAVIVSGLLYFLVALVTVLSTTQQELVESTSPLALAFGDWRPGSDVITVIGMLAGLNGALVQIVMASRVAYGLAGQDQAPSVFARVNGITRTPLHATAAVTAVVLILAVSFQLESLAKATSSILLVVYGLVNVSLWKIKGRIEESPHDGPSFPRGLPLAATVVCVTFLLLQLLSWI